MTALIENPISQSEFVCDCAHYFKSACKQEGFFKSHNGKNYCVLHYPKSDQEKIIAFTASLEKKLAAQDYDFRGVVFPFRAKLNDLEINKTADFYGTVLCNGVDFSRSRFISTVNFSAAELKDALFEETAFEGDVHFSNTQFKDTVSFSSLEFKRVYFNNAEFSGRCNFLDVKFFDSANFDDVSFDNIYFCDIKTKRPVVFETPLFKGIAEFGGLNDTLHFKHATFEKKLEIIATEFIDLVFYESVFKDEVEIKNTTFQSATFDFSRFEKQLIVVDSSYKQYASFWQTHFTETDFIRTHFAIGTNFLGAIFNERVDFNNATFRGNISFAEAIFKDYVRFQEIKTTHRTTINFQNVLIDKPERVLFQSLNLNPTWFINVDSRKFNFWNIDWGKKKIDVRKAADLILTRHINSPYSLLTPAYRNLALNAEDNHRYDEAMRFRYASMDASLQDIRTQWRERWTKPVWRKFSFETFSFWWSYSVVRKIFSLTWWYWILSGYGERVARATFWLVALLFFFTVVYTQVGFNNPSYKIEMPNTARPETPLDLKKSFAYAIGTPLLQRPEPRPFTTTAQIFVYTEIIIVPLQGALLALAIRRRFMR